MVRVGKLLVPVVPTGIAFARCSSLNDTQKSQLKSVPAANGD